ncbi:unnamed protein product, partial [Amoebophrya sp. A120]|eukprot:GSA120T00020679001.1
MTSSSSGSTAQDSQPRRLSEYSYVPQSRRNSVDSVHPDRGSRANFSQNYANFSSGATANSASTTTTTSAHHQQPAGRAPSSSTTREDQRGRAANQGQQQRGLPQSNCSNAESPSEGCSSSFLRIKTLTWNVAGFTPSSGRGTGSSSSSNSDNEVDNSFYRPSEAASAYGGPANGGTPARTGASSTSSSQVDHHPTALVKLKLQQELKRVMFSSASSDEDSFGAASGSRTTINATAVISSSSFGSVTNDVSSCRAAVEQLPDIIFLGLQEVVELKMNPMFNYYFFSKKKNKQTNEDRTKLTQWEDHVLFPVLQQIYDQQNQDENFAYYIAKKEQLIGLALFVIVKRKLVVNFVDVFSVKTAALGLVGTKGALVAVVSCAVEDVEKNHGTTTANRNIGDDVERNARGSATTSRGLTVKSSSSTAASNRKAARSYTVAGINCHLPSGDKPESVEERKQAVLQIFGELAGKGVLGGAGPDPNGDRGRRNSGNYSGQQLQQNPLQSGADFFLFFGDLNARMIGGSTGAASSSGKRIKNPDVMMSNHATYELKPEDVAAYRGVGSHQAVAGAPPQAPANAITTRDDLAAVLRPLTYLGVFQEPKIFFPPTYKYLRQHKAANGPPPGASNRPPIRLLLDAGKSEPAYTDRILYKIIREDNYSTGPSTGTSGSGSSKRPEVLIETYDVDIPLWVASNAATDHLPVKSSMCLKNVVPLYRSRSSTNRLTAASANATSSNFPAATLQPQAKAVQVPRPGGVAPVAGGGAGSSTTNNPKMMNMNSYASSSSNASTTPAQRTPPQAVGTSTTVNNAKVVISPTQLLFQPFSSLNATPQEVEIQCTPANSLVAIYAISTTSSASDGGQENSGGGRSVMNNSSWYRITTYSMKVSDFGAELDMAAPETRSSAGTHHDTAPSSQPALMRPIWVGYGSQKIKIQCLADFDGGEVPTTRTGNGASSGANSTGAFLGVNLCEILLVKPIIRGDQELQHAGASASKSGRGQNSVGSSGSSYSSGREMMNSTNRTTSVFDDRNGVYLTLELIGFFK